MQKYLVVGIVLIAVIAGGAIWWLNLQPTLIDLQKAYLFAETDAEKEKVINRLENYYLNLSIPDSIRERVDEEVATVLETTEINMAEFSKENWNTTNVYVLEKQLKSLFKTAMIARAKEEIALFEELTVLATEMAQIVDTGTENDYWVPLVKEVRAYTKEKVVAWLKAERAERLCSEYHDNDIMWKTAEMFASLGLRHLSQLNDKRIKIDIMQRLQVILYQYRSFHELSFGLAQRYFKKAEKIKYQLRANGINYNYANALHLAGRNRLSLELFQETINIAEQYSDVQYMEWYKRNGLLRIAELFWELADYEKAISTCQEVTKFNLKETEKIELQIMKGLIQRSLGNYEIAEAEYKMGLRLLDSTNDILNKTLILNNIGALHFYLTEYDFALNYYSKARSLLEKNNPEDYTSRILIITNMAEVMAKIKNVRKFNELILEADGLIEFVELPSRKAQILRTLGRLNMELKMYESASKSFREAFSIYSANGLLRLGLATKLDLAKSIISLNKLTEVEDMVSEIHIQSNQINDVEKIIDSIALLAEIEFKKGNINKALETSGQLIHKIELLSSRFEIVDKLVLYRQKIYDYLKNSVIYEIHNNRIDSAFVKLDYAKARALKNLGQELSKDKSLTSMFMDINTIKSRLDYRSLVVDYLVTEDTLYAFLLDRDHLQLFRKKIDLEKLRKTVNDYITSIQKTIEVFNNYEPETVDAHFNYITQLGQKLYHDLMGWPGLELQLKDIDLLFVVPDEFLYKLPFSTLIADATDPLTYLLHKAGVVNLPSASLLSSTDIIQSLDLQNKRVLLSADPNFPGAKEFVADIKQLFPLTEELTIQAAPFNKKAVLDELNQGHDFYILLGHGVANSKNPQLSYMELYIENPLQYASKKIKISIADLKEIDWPGAKMVFLVGCETAGRKLYRGTGIAGLQQGLLSLGVESVLASLWKIDAKHAIPQTRDILQSWILNSNHLAIALRKSQLKAIKKLQQNRIYNNPNPYFWGSYILSTRI